MSKAFRLFWPFIIIAGFEIIVGFNIGKGITDPGFWLIPLGFCGGMISIYKRLGISRIKPLLIIWILALCSYGVAGYDYYRGKGFASGLVMLPVCFGLTAAGVIAMVIYSLRD